MLHVTVIHRSCLKLEPSHVSPSLHPSLQTQVEGHMEGVWIARGSSFREMHALLLWALVSAP